MAILHFKEYPFHRDLFALDVREVEGDKFSDWQKNANYAARVNVILQVDSYNISKSEYAVDAGIITIAGTYSFLNIYQTWHVENVSFEKFQTLWANFEVSLEQEVYRKLYQLNNARKQAGLPTFYTGEWYINYSNNEKHIEVRRP